jgi:hypothetical protein
MRPVECLPGSPSGIDRRAASWGIAASVGEGAPQRSKARPTPHDAGRRPECRVLADLRRAQQLARDLPSVDREGL